MRIPIELAATLGDAAKMTGGVALGDPCSPLPSFLTTDTRELRPGDWFCALQGKKDDGNLHLTDACFHGAGMLLSRKAPVFPHPPTLLHRDPMAALEAIAARHAAKVFPRTVAVTGSVGKTTTRACIASVLASSFRVTASEENRNNRLGLLLSMLAMPQNTEYAVWELGTGAPGELRPLSLRAKPDIAVITKIGSAHIGAYGDRETLCREKATICCGLKPDGILLCPADEPFLAELPCREKTFALIPGNADFSGRIVRQEQEATYLEFWEKDRSLGIFKVAGFGIPTLSAAVIAIAVGRLAGLSPERIREGLGCYLPVKGRGGLFQLGGITFLDDGYNASAESMFSAFDRLAFLTAKEHRVALLGDILELGNAEHAIHRAIGRHFAESCGGRLFLYGKNALRCAEGAAEAGMPASDVTIFPSGESPARYAERMHTYLRPGDCLLVKGSHATGAEEILRILSEIL